MLRMSRFFACCMEDSSAMLRRFKYVIVGGGTAAGYACREFVAQNVGVDKVAVVTAEPVAPYERPALTKAYIHPPSAKTHVMSRLFNPQLAKWMEEQFTSRGVKLISGDVVREFKGSEGKLTGAQLKSDKNISCEIAVVGAGAVPNVDFCPPELKREQGGLLVDAMMQTSQPDVYAVGDIATFPSRYGGFRRCENVDHARKSAAQAVKAAMGLKPEPYHYLPYLYTRIFEYTDSPIVFNFFGDQSENCQVAGRGEKSIGAIWQREGKVVGALIMGSPGPTAEDQAKLRQLADSGPAATEAAEVFAQVGL